MDRSAMPWRALEDRLGTENRAPGDPPDPELATKGPGPIVLVAGLGLAALLAVGAFALAASSPQGEIVVDGGSGWAASGGPSGAPSSGPGGRLVVDVQGAVLRPGLVELAAGARVGDAIAAAGGYSPRVDTGRAGQELNLAALLADGARIVVPSRDDIAVAGPSGATTGEGDPGSAGGLIDLNTATAAELDELPGVGPVTAQKIIDARTEKPFASVDELRDRKIVGPSTFEKLRDLVTAG